MESKPILKKLPAAVLIEYINKFYGYGDWTKASFWFIGIEEGGGGDFDAVKKRLATWEKLGRKELVDKDELHMGFVPNYIPENHKSQTWNRLILTRLSFELAETSTAEIGALKRKDWGQFDSNNLLIELFPLPSPGVKNWYYPDWVDLSPDLRFLKDREQYKANVVGNRVQYIKSKIGQHKPKVVLFYGKTMERYWNEIIGTDQLESRVFFNHKIRYIKQNDTLYVQCPQPSYIRAYVFWKELGKEIKRLSDKILAPN